MTATTQERQKEKVLITGATGYVGGRLLRDLEKDGRYQIRCLARVPENVKVDNPGQVEVVKGDLLDPTSLQLALQGIDIAFYLVHSLNSPSGFEQHEEEAAKNFAAAAKGAGIKRIIYLGGLGSGGELSPHLRTRHVVGEILRSSGIVVIEFRASIIIGSGSLSFNLVRALVEKLPVMITPRWVYSQAQPIGIRDVLAYLKEAMTLEFTKSEVFEIGGPDRVAYVDLMTLYAAQRRLKRYMIPVPFLSPNLSSLWLGLVTPVYARIGRKLVDSLRNDTVVNDTRALEVFKVRPIGSAEAIARALKLEDENLAETRWCDALSSGRGMLSYGGVRFGSRIIDSRSLEIATKPERAFAVLQRIGGENGWFFADILWRIRGAIDLLVGGVGMRRGRAHPTKIRVGEPIDFWRVEEFKPGVLIRLKAEMKVPGRAWLQFEVSPSRTGSRITQTAIFDPLGIFGLLYWYLLYPLHALIFSGMLREIARRAEQEA